MGTLYKPTGCKFWYVDLTDNTGQRIRKSTRTRDKATALQILAELELRSAQIEWGIRSREDVDRLEKAKQPIAKDFDAYFETLKMNASGTRHINEERAKLDRLAVECCWPNIASIACDSFLDWLVVYKDYSAKTKNGYRRVVKSFTRWCVTTRRLLADPMQSLPIISTKEASFHRRALLREEWQVLKEFLDKDKTERLGMSGVERRRLYEFAIVTGLRASEILSLKVGSFDFETNSVAISGTATKNKKKAVQPISETLSAELKKAFRLFHPDSNAFTITNRFGLADCLRDDCEAARRNWLASAHAASRKQREATRFLANENEAGETLDFHSLRHTSGAWLVAAGVDLVAVKNHMRHSTITLTANTYGHLLPSQSQAIRKAFGS